MNSTVKWLLGGVAIGLLLLLLRWLPAPIQVQASPSVAAGSETGRYSLAISKDFVYFLDTKTGRLWWQYTGARPGSSEMVWNEVSSPVAPVQK